MSISTPNPLAAQRRLSGVTTSSPSTTLASATSPERGRPTYTFPHPRDLTPKGRRNSLSHNNDNPAEKVAELTAKFRISIPKRRGSGASGLSNSTSEQSITSMQQAAQEEAEREAERRRKELGHKLAVALEKGDVVVAPASTINEQKLREIRLDSAVNLGTTKEVPLRLSTSRSKSGTESGDITMSFPTTTNLSTSDDAAKNEGGGRSNRITWERQEVGKDANVDVGRYAGGPSYDPAHRLNRRNSSLAIATAKAAGIKRVVIAPPPGRRGFGAAKLSRGNGQSDGTGDGRLSHAALLRLPPAAAAAKSQALLSEGPMPKRRKSSAKSAKSAKASSDRPRSRSRDRIGEIVSEESTEDGEEDGEEEGDEWDEESLLQLTDWWRQVLAAGATPSPKEMVMMDSFLAEFIKEDMPRVDMILRTRLHRLLVAIIDGAEIRGEGEDEERFHELAKKASLLERRWMKATRGRLFGMERERREIMFGNSGRLAQVKPWSKGEEKETRWVTERNERAGMADVEPGA